MESNLLSDEKERLQSEKGCSYPEFISYVEYLVKQIFGDNLVFMRDIYSDPKTIPAPCITYKLISKVPGSIGKATKELKPRERQKIPDPENPNHHIKIYGQRFDVFLQFDIWARNDQEADQLELRFEQMMIQYSGFFSQNGVVGIYFDSQLADKDAQSLRLDLSCRSMRYLVLLEQLTEVRIHDIEQIIINYKLMLDPTKEHPETDRTDILKK
jgi:hypothetical protein